MESCKVTVTQGVLQGQACTTYSGRDYFSFEGIPYAKPPIGKLRFMSPQPPEPWTGVKDATKPGNKCAQLNPMTKTKMEGSEDCLYLNVYTPKLPAESIEKLPVIFYVHGGRYILGYGDYYRPDYFLQNDVVLVTINYRLHILGFLCLHTKEVPGNAGLKDAVAALKWVKENIKYFNGNENNVTVLGESSGAGTVTALLASKMTDGLFHKIIAESGSCLSDLFMVEEDVMERAKFITTHLGKETKSVNEMYEFLLNCTVEELCEAVCVAEYLKPTIDAFFLPVVEKKFDGTETFFEEYPLKTFKDNRFKKVPVLMGYASHESGFFIPFEPDGSVLYQTDLSLFLPRYLFIEKGSHKEKKIVSGLHKFYFAGKDVNKDTKLEYIHFISDAYFLRDIHAMLDLMVKHHNQVYVYRFEYTGNMSTRVMKNLGIKGASHGDILQYQFYKKNKADDATEDDKRIVKFFSDAWYGFVKTGKPSWPEQSVEWLPYTADKRYVFNISNDFKLMANPDNERIEVWKKLMGERSKL